MKLIKNVLVLLIFTCFFSGCGKINNKDVVKNFTKKIESLESYHLNGILEIINDENNYLYDVDVLYLKDNNFKVSLKNQTNNHEQIILRNNEGVYVLTPSLGKSFKFQSEWPYNNSQSYLLHNLLNDIKNDSEYTFEIKDDKYIITTKSNYSNNKELVSQRIYLDKDNNLNLVEVLDSNGMVKLKMAINNIDYKTNLSVDDFKLENSMTTSNDYNTVSKLDDITYPMYIPQNTYLSTQDKVSKEDGERVILTFAGDYPFMLIQETLSSDSSVMSVYGNPLQLANSIGVIDDTSITWIDGGIEYYLVSNTLDKDQLIEVANSLTVSAIQK